MKTLFRFALAGTLLVAGSMFAKADTVLWTLNDVVFSDGATVTGWFETDSNNINNYIDEFDITVTDLANPSRSFTIQTSDQLQEFDYAALPTEISFGKDPGYSPYIDLNVQGSLSATGGTASLTAGYLCPGCATLDVNSDHSPSVTGVLGGSPTPEPATLPILAAAVVGVAVFARRKFAHTN